MLLEKVCYASSPTPRTKQPRFCPFSATVVETSLHFENRWRADLPVSAHHDNIVRPAVFSANTPLTWGTKKNVLPKPQLGRFKSLEFV